MAKKEIKNKKPSGAKTAAPVTPKKEKKEPTIMATPLDEDVEEFKKKLGAPSKEDTPSLEKQMEKMESLNDEINKFADVNKRLEEMVAKDPEHIKENIESELENVKKMEKELSEKIAKKESELNTKEKDVLATMIKAKQFSQFWNGTNNSWES